MYGFPDAASFYHAASCKHYIADIDRPVLLVNALNDPMLPESCFPVKQSRDHPFFHLHVTSRGGHVGYSSVSAGPNWSELRALQFVKNNMLGA